MFRINTIYWIFLLGLVGCKNAEQPIDKLEMAKAYFKALDTSDSEVMQTLLADSLLTTVPKYDYDVRYSKKDYLSNWFAWDAVFIPNYEVLDMQLENGSVKAKVSKSDTRIHFLMKKPFLTYETLKFKDNKIHRIETEHLNFDEALWEKNRTELLNWIDTHHPELNGFIYDQTETGAKNYLKAMQYYETRQ